MKKQVEELLCKVLLALGALILLLWFWIITWSYGYFEGLAREGASVTLYPDQLQILPLTLYSSFFAGLFSGCIIAISYMKLKQQLKNVQRNSDVN